MKRFLGIIAGVVVAIVVIFGLEILNHRLFPWPMLAASDSAGFAAALAAVPLAAKLLIVAGWLFGAFLGSSVALRISRWPASVWFVAGFVLLGGIANILMIPHPVWMQIAAFAAPLLGGFVARRLG